jgi:hypothetical protein
MLVMWSGGDMLSTMVEATSVETVCEDEPMLTVPSSLRIRRIIGYLAPPFAAVATIVFSISGVGAISASSRSTATSSTSQVITPGEHEAASTVSIPLKRVGSVAKPALSAEFTPTIDWTAGRTLGTFDNVGAHAVADCTIAAAADYEQIVQDSRTPLNAGPWLAEYTSLVTSAGETPGPKTGVFPAALFRAWKRPNQTGTRIATATSIRTAVGTLRAALSSSPVFVTIDLAPAGHNTRSTLDAATGIVSTPWSSAVTGPYGPSTITESHSALLVGVDETHKEFLLASWGQTYAIPYSFFESMVTAAWIIRQ